MSRRGEVLVAIIPTRLDFDIARTRLWYRIPVEEVNNRLRKRWPPEWIAFYQTQVFGAEAHSVNYYGRVVEIRQVSRRDMFPQEPSDERSKRQYYQLFFDELRRLPEPIRSLRLRRLVFIPTTWAKFTIASEINDLFDESPLEEALWRELKALRIAAERQERVDITDRTYFLDFAVYCGSGKLDIETDGDTWHATPKRASLDNLRQNDLHATGWRTLRFGTSQIREEMGQYCVPKIVQTINKLGGIDEGAVPRRIPVRGADGSYQPGLFEESTDV